MIEKKLTKDCRLAFSGSFQENSCLFKKKLSKKKKNLFPLGQEGYFYTSLLIGRKKIYLMWVTGLKIVIFFKQRVKIRTK